MTEPSRQNRSSGSRPENRPQSRPKSGSGPGGGRARNTRGAQGQRGKTSRGDGPVALTPLPHHLLDDPRARACDAIAVQCARYPNLQIHGPDESGLSPRDASLAHSIYDTAIRRMISLRPLIDRHLSTKMAEIEPAVQAALLAGSVQLLLMDRIPAHAALDRTVEWAKRRIRPGAGKLVNAVLRKVSALAGPESRFRPQWTNLPDELPLSDGRALIIDAGLLPADPIARAALANGIPRPLFNRWADQHGPDDAEHMAHHSLIRPPTVLNIDAWSARVTVKNGGEPTLDQFPKGLVPHELPGSAVWTGPRGGLAELLSAHPEIHAQDAAASEPLRLLSQEPPRRMLDLCAGRGTKTAQALALFSEAEFIATDTSRARLADLRVRFDSEPRVTVIDSAELHDRAAGWADLLVLDVPCSNSGVLARRAEARHRSTREILERLVRTQQEIITGSRGYLAKGGRTLYATCSVDSHENEAQIDWMAEEFGLSVAAVHRRLPVGTPGGPTTAYSDGSFAALMAP